MADDVTIGGIVKTSIVTAFTIAAALTWKDVILETWALFFPSDVLLYKFLVAILFTIAVVIAIYIILKTEAETEEVIKRLKDKNDELKKQKNKKKK